MGLDSCLIITGNPFSGIFEIGMPSITLSSVSIELQIATSMVVQKQGMVPKHPVILFGNVIG